MGVMKEGRGNGGSGVVGLLREILVFMVVLFLGKRVRR